jgi:hypothetical protein
MNGRREFVGSRNAKAKCEYLKEAGSLIRLRILRGFPIGFIADGTNVAGFCAF